ncbi:MAG: dephospho-CoA kinase [Clostridium sp.]|nr:MAG: dephospho-CoA kinase [Clostridium sp.]
MHRDNISKAEAINIINKQMDLNLKAKMSDYVIDTSGTFLETRNKVLDVLEVIACH